MDLPKNRFKTALLEGRRQIGLWCTINDTVVAEMLAGCGYDWMMFDTEHSPLDPIQVLPLLQAVAPYPVSPIVRPGSANPVEIKKLLDCGAQTLLVPMVNTAEEAEATAAAVAYPPVGVRGVSGVTRASRFGTVAGYHKRAREEICLIVQIETRQALDNLEAIASVEGVDAVFVGPADLAAGLGYPGEPSHPEVKAACIDAFRRLAAVGVPSGILTLDTAFLDEVVEAGCAFPAVDVDITLLRRSAAAKAAEWASKSA